MRPETAPIRAQAAIDKRAVSDNQWRMIKNAHHNRSYFWLYL